MKEIQMYYFKFLQKSSTYFFEMYVLNPEANDLGKSIYATASSFVES
jgi:hypothetical protein